MTVILLAIVVAIGLPVSTAVVALMSRLGRPGQGASSSAEPRRTAQSSVAPDQRRTFLTPLVGLTVLIALGAISVFLLGTAAMSSSFPGMGMGGDMNQMMRGMMGGGSGAATTGSANGYGEVQIATSAFQPSQMNVTVGTLIRWTNLNGVPHTVTARDGSFGSGRLDRGQTFEYTFSESGSYDYVCAYHPGMTGRITVSQASQ